MLEMLCEGDGDGDDDDDDEEEEPCDSHKL
jgi:hypothetical protein